MASSTLVEQYDGLVFLIESGELEDAFALDRAKPETVIKKGRKQLAHYEDRDFKYLRELNVTRVRRLHNTMTNRLREICSAHGLRVEQGQRLDCRYDAMIREYRPGRDLLIEAKTDNSMPMVRMAIGQLYDYHRKLPEHDRVDCAVLLPTAPTSEQRGLLAHADIKAIWFDKRMKRIDGDAEIPAKKS